MRNAFSTSIMIKDELGETEYDVRVTYEGHAGHKGDLYDPGLVKIALNGSFC